MIPTAWFLSILKFQLLLAQVDRFYPLTINMAAVMFKVVKMAATLRLVISWQLEVEKVGVLVKMVVVAVVANLAVCVPVGKEYLVKGMMVTLLKVL